MNPISEGTRLQVIQQAEIEFQSVTGLKIRASDAPASSIVDDFYAGYDKAFVLPNEKEELVGFRECLALNHGTAFSKLQNRFGPFREIVAIFSDPQSGFHVGGANLIAFPARAKPDPGSPLLTINLNYVFVAPEARGKGHLRSIAAAISEVASAFFRGTSDHPFPTCEPVPALVFIEQNDPLRISEADAAADTRHSGLDQFDRISIWTKIGARVIDFPYVQPPLSAHQAADTGLLLSVYGTLPKRLDACDLSHHLERFFAISVLKGADLHQQPEAAAQLHDLANACRAGRSFALLDPTEALISARAGRSENSNAQLSLRSFLLARE